MAKTYTISVIGGGGGGRLSMDGAAASSRYELVTACDQRPEVCEKLRTDYPGLRTFTSHEEMFRECPTDVVCVSTWPPSHREIALSALELPLSGILVEKPLGDTAAAGREIIGAIRKKGIPVAVPHGLLVARHAEEVLARVRGGEIGELKLVEIQCSGWDIINAGIHWLNFFVMLTRGDPAVSVHAAVDKTTRTYRDSMQVETIAVTYAQTQSGGRVVMETGDEVNVAREGKHTLFRLAGTAGTIEFWGWESAYRVSNAAFPSGKDFQVERYAESGHQRHLENMAAQMDEGAPDYAVIESSQAALELCEGAYLSARHGCRVTLPLDKFEPPESNEWDPGRPYSGEGGGRDGRQSG